MGVTSQDEKRLAAAKALIGELAQSLNLDAFVRLWDGSRVPLGAGASGPFEIIINDPGVIASSLRAPSLETIIRHYIDKRIDFSGGPLRLHGHQRTLGFARPFGAHGGFHGRRPRASNCGD